MWAKSGPKLKNPGLNWRIGSWIRNPRPLQQQSREHETGRDDNFGAPQAEFGNEQFQKRCVLPGRLVKVRLSKLGYSDLRFVRKVASSGGRPFLLLYAHPAQPGDERRG